MKNNFILITLALFSIGLLFFVKSYEHKPQNHTQAKKNPQEYMTQFFVTVFTTEGGVKNRLSANYWAYQPETEGSTLTTPHLVIYKPNGTLWTIDADRGFIKQAHIGTLDQIDLHNNVVINRPATGTFVPMTLETNELYYQPSKEYAETDQLVVMRKPGLKISGIGMRAFLDKGSVELLRDVKTYYTSTH
ncbi:MAG TPA: LPS export ABC transporter periplasmic protein LptC [Gammaproteobacteria bacterium]|nr:LPS export ABC transporter periplasmic protein LptC [Gammaproteobacteria bacterium]